MAFIELLWKARTIEKYRLRYEKEKHNAIRLIDAQDTKKTFYQRIVNYNVTAKDRISKTLLKRYPKGSNVYNLWYYMKTDQTFPNFLLKSVIGFVGGIILTYLCFMFFVFQLSISLIHATIMSSIIGVLLTLGLAFSYRVRCLVFLLLPQFFSRVGRYTLTCYALVLILTGPATNTLKNSEVLSESLACEEEQIKTTMGQIKSMEMKKPFVSMKETIKLLVDDINALADKMQLITVRLNRLIQSLALSIQSSYEWLSASCNRCNEKLGTPYERCQDFINDAIIQCQVLLGPLFSKICNLGKINKLACFYAKPLDAFCKVVEFGNSQLMEVVTTRLNTFTERVNSIFSVDVHLYHPITSSSNISRYPNQVPPGIVTEIRNKADLFLTWISWSSTITSASLLLIIFRAKYYQHMYETRSRFDNRYITGDLRELDIKRLHQGKETVLPLNRRELGKYIKTTSFRLMSSEKIHISRSAVTMAITTFKLLIHMVADYSLYWVLMTIRKHGIKQTPLSPETFDSSIYVSGTGLLSKIFRFLLETISAPLRGPPASPVTCLPDPHPPDFQRYTQIGVLICLLWFFALFEPYGLRLRHVIMGHYRPERAQARALWLYNHIQRTRGCFLKFARRKLHKEYKYCSEESHTLRNWLNNNIRFFWLKCLLGVLPHDPHCVLCGVIENGYILIRCRTPCCPGRFCIKCFHDLGELCTICLRPHDYGDLSDVSLEKGSSNDSGSDSDDGNASRPLCKKPYFVMEMEKKKHKPKYSKQNEKEKRRGALGKTKINIDKTEKTEQDQISEYLNDQMPGDDNENKTFKNISDISKQERYMRKANVIRHRKLVNIELEDNPKNDDTAMDKAIVCAICSKYCKIHQFTGNINKVVVNSEYVRNSSRVFKDTTFDKSLEREDINKRSLSITGSNLTQPTYISDETVQRLLRHFRMLRKYSVNRKQLDRKFSSLSCSFTTISSSFWRTCFCTEIEELQERKRNKSLQKNCVQKNELKLSKESSTDNCDRELKVKPRPKKTLTISAHDRKKIRMHFRSKSRIPKYSRAQKLRYRETSAITIKASLLINRMCFSKRSLPRHASTSATRVNRRPIDVMSQGDNSRKVENFITNKEKEDLVSEQDETRNNQSPLPDKDKEISYFINLADIHKKPKRKLLKKCSSYILNKVCSSLHRPFSFMYNRGDISDENSRKNHKRRKKFSQNREKTDEKATARAYRISTYLSDMDWVKRCKKSDSVCVNKQKTKVGAALIEDFINADEGNKILFDKESNAEVQVIKEKHEIKKCKPKKKKKKNYAINNEIQTVFSSRSSELVIGEVNYENAYEANHGDDIKDAELSAGSKKSIVKLKTSKSLKKKGTKKEKKEPNRPTVSPSIIPGTKKEKQKPKGHVKIKKTKEIKKKMSVIQHSVIAKDVSLKIGEPTNIKSVIKPKKSFWGRMFSKKKQILIIDKADAEITAKPPIISCSCQASHRIQVSKSDKEVTAAMAVEFPSPRKKHYRNVCTYHKNKDSARARTNTFDLPETTERIIGYINYSDYNMEGLKQPKSKTHHKKQKSRTCCQTHHEVNDDYKSRTCCQTHHEINDDHKPRTCCQTHYEINDDHKPRTCCQTHHEINDDHKPRTCCQTHHEINDDHKWTQTKSTVVINNEVQCDKIPKLKSSTPKAVRIADSFITLTKCPSVSSIFSNGDTKSDTSVYSVIVGYADDGHKFDRSTTGKLKNRRPLQYVITKANQSTLTDVRTVCDVSTTTTDWWSPIMDRKHNTALSPRRKENREKKRNVGVYTKIMDTRGVSTTNKVVTFKSHAQLIPPQPSNILSPSRYLLESQRYYNELFSEKLYLPYSEEFPFDKKILTPLRRNNSPLKRRVSRTKRLEEIQIGRRRIKNPHLLENVWTASESSHKRFAVDKTDSTLSQRQRYRSGRKQISTQISRHRHLRSFDEKSESLKVKVRQGEVLLYSGPSLSKDDLSVEVQCPSNPPTGSF